MPNLFDIGISNSLLAPPLDLCRSKTKQKMQAKLLMAMEMFFCVIQIQLVLQFFFLFQNPAVSFLHCHDESN
jgi:hypothetical protein